MDVFPENTLTKFRTKLSQPIRMNGEWEVGLAEIAYPQSWYNVRKNDVMTWRVWPHRESEADRPADPLGLFTGKLHTTEYRLRAGTYLDAQELLGEMTRLMQEQSGGGTSPTQVHFEKDRISNKITIRVLPGAQLWISRDLSLMLGLGPNLTERRLRPGIYIGSNVLDLNQGFASLYVYCDLVVPRPVGDTAAPLLRTVPLDGSAQTVKNRSQTFQNIYFLPMITNHFQVIEIDIRDDTGKPVPFERGKVEVTLVLKEADTFYRW